MRVRVWLVGLVVVPAVLVAGERRVTIETVKGETIEGTFRGASEDEISIELAGQALKIPVASVRYVSFAGRVMASRPATPGSVDDAFNALDELDAIVKVGILRE